MEGTKVIYHDPYIAEVSVTLGYEPGTRVTLETRKRSGYSVKT